MEIKLIKNVLEVNERQSEENKKIFDAHGIFVCNIMSSPGSGKTTLLQKTIPVIKERSRVAVIEGDIYTTRDALRLKEFNIPVVQINTGGGCHLNAAMIAEAMKALPLKDLDAVIIENVGNLVCPAEFNIGEDEKILIYSITEGDDKPAKYPLSFTNAGAIVINKMDLAPYCQVNIDKLKLEINQHNNTAPLFMVSALKGSGLIPWTDWLLSKIENKSR
ncbi:MAG: hydrogenase nickel incorporation protein HypB [Deltaproteobacteria bacterium]|nr:hydrogenase nickel incorporation protein HypB [Deltaproteobacteria bacterium]